MPRLLVAGLSGGSGKTLVALGLLLKLRSNGLAVQAFKKGPDYIDAAWLGWASAHPARNLDTFLMGPDVVLSSFLRTGVEQGINVIEGARGLFDGFDVSGTHSSAVLSKHLKAPVVLVVDATKITRTAAALVLGCQKLDPEIPIRAVILNNVNGRRHEQILRGAIESICSIPVAGVIPKAGTRSPVPERHLGLVPPQEYGDLEELERGLMRMVGDNIDLELLRTLAEAAPPLNVIHEENARPRATRNIKIGYLKDSAFNFYYPENLELLEEGGAEVIPISALRSAALPDALDALYIGGGFPETHAKALSRNRTFLDSIHHAVEEGMPIYAECGGLMLLSRALWWKGARYEMANVFPFEVDVSNTAQGHGYSELLVDTPNAFFPLGATLRGHEFHYSRVVPQSEWTATACQVRRGAGCFSGRDAAIVRNVWAGYTHLHALATPEWASGLLQAAERFASQAVPCSH
jgi:cobyrinic acid a,c-diamide synthase